MGEDTLLENDDAVEALLGKAAPRPVPPDVETTAVRDAVHAEWQQVTGKRHSRTRVTRWAMAATVLIAVFVTLNLLRTTGIEPVQVATINKQFGVVTVLGANAEALQQDDLSGVLAGQTIRTRPDSGIGFAWAAGGSLRMDASSRVEFISDTEIFLHEGRVYFDSEPALAAGSMAGADVPFQDVPFRILTRYGEVAHIGTQYMAQSDAGELVVSVREGAVEVLPQRGEAGRAERNQQIAISGSGIRGIVNIRSHGGAWQWVEQTSPAASLDGRSVDEFLGWVSHETGLRIDYESDAARIYADQELLNGTLETSPREALHAWMLGTDLDWRIDDGVIYVSKAR